MTIKMDEKKGVVGAEGAPREFGKGGPAPKIEPRAGKALSSNRKMLLSNAILEIAKSDDKTAIERLLEAGADINARDDNRGMTLLERVMEHWRQEIAEADYAHLRYWYYDDPMYGGDTLQRCGDRVERATHIAKILIERGADVTGRDDGGKGMLYYCRHMGFRSTKQQYIELLRDMLEARGAVE